MSAPVEAALCGPYELVAPRAGALRERADGVVELEAESRYLVRLQPGADPDTLTGALTVPRGGTEGVLQFGNFFGIAELGGRPLNILSNRLSGDAVQDMLNDVADNFASLPFGAATPTVSSYVRGRSMAADALYHAYAFVRDAMRARGPHDLPGTVERILARPHETLHAQSPRLTPLAGVTRIDASTLSAIHRSPELLATVPADSPLFDHPLARQLQGRMPAYVHVVPLAHDTDTQENRFVVAALDALSDVARRFASFARASHRPSSAINAREATNIADRLQRWRRHRAIGQLQPGHALPIHSTVLRGRVGYRELLAIYTELLARTCLTEPDDLQPLLELRDAALIYEYWCYFKLVAAIGTILDRPAEVSRLTTTPLGVRVPYGYRSDWGDVEALYNITFSASAAGSPTRGWDSYSVRLRPDITVRVASRQVHLFDAKLKLGLTKAFSADDIDDDTQDSPDTFKRQDLYKMHAYRDALGSDSAWIIYPGTEATPQAYVASWHATEQPGLFQGVGAVALRPGAAHDGGLAELLRKLVETGLEPPSC